MQVCRSPLRINLIASLMVGMVLLAIAPLSLLAQSQQERYFPDTGHTVRGEFLDFYNSRGGLRIFGFPITEEFQLNGRAVQYFQRVRMELHPEKQAAERVQLALLGEELGSVPLRSQRRDPIPISNGIFHKRAIWPFMPS